MNINTARNTGDVARIGSTIACVVVRFLTAAYALPCVLRNEMG